MPDSHIKTSEYTRPYYALIVDAIERGLPIDPHRFTTGDIFAAVFDDQCAPARRQKPKLEVPQAPFTAVLISGFINEIFPEAAFAKAMQNLQQQGKIDYIPFKIPGRRGSEHNADVIAQQIKDLPAGQPLWLVAHSKGGLDSLHFLAKYPVLAQERVWGLSTLASPIMGSTYPEHFILKRVADELIERQMQTQIDFYPEEIRESLQPAYRAAWFKEHQADLPPLKYSCLAFQLSKYMSAPTMSLTKIIFAQQAANDGMVDTASASFPEEFPHVDFNVIEADHLIGQSKDPLPQTAVIAAHLIMFKYLHLI